MRVTILNGALEGDAFTDAVADRIAVEYAQQGADITNWRLRDRNVAYCLGCFQCWTHSPGVCRIDDDAQAITASIVQCDVQVNITPVTFGGYSSESKKILDRSICIVLPFFMQVNGETHHEPRYEKNPELRAVGVLPTPDPQQESIFRKLVERNAINMHSPTHEVTFVYRDDSAENVFSDSASNTAYEPALPVAERTT